MKTAVLLGMVGYYKPSTPETEVGSFIIVKNKQTNKQKMQHSRN